MKQHSTPIFLKDSKATVLEKVSLHSGIYNEAWIQELCFNHPQLLPVEEIEPTFRGMIPICKELAVPSGPIDLVYINDYGFITIGECKLWRNPEARRKVIGQILDYAKDLAKWDYTLFESACLKARGESSKSLLDVLRGYYPDIEEHKFIDSVQSNLNKGRFLLAVIGDGIRENMEELANYIHQNGNLNFTLGLIELPIYKTPSDELLVTPRVLAKTKEIERIIYRIDGGHVEEKSSTKNLGQESKTISEKVFFERLENNIGKERTDEFQKFIEELKTEQSIIPKLGRGNRLSLNLKSPNDTYNFASVQETGEVWFYGIVVKTEELGDKKIGVNYLENLAELINGDLYDKYKEWQWCIKKDNKYPNISDFLDVKNNWKRLIAETIDQTSKLEDT